MIPQKIHHILFDFDYTLADSSEGIIASVNHALHQVGHPAADPEAIRRMIGHSLEDTFAQFLSNGDGAVIQRCKALFMQHADSGVMVEKTYFLDGVAETLEQLHSDFYTLGIVSTKRRLSIEMALKRNELLDYFDVIIGYEDVTSVKPDPEGLLKAVAAVAGTADDTLYVGDSLVDVEASRNAALEMIGVATGTTPAQALSQYVTTVERLADVVQCLSVPS